jgi:hypothetical protein
MAQGMHERIYGPVISRFRCQYLFAEYNSFFEFLSAGKSESFQRLTVYENSETSEAARVLYLEMVIFGVLFE